MLLSNAELADAAAHFGVAEEQVRRDHLISHLLHALASPDLPLTFFDGTALARTILTDPSTGGRMSEDIDLYTPERTRLAGVPRRPRGWIAARRATYTTWQRWPELAR